jgi:hypothetical protein
MVVLAFEAVRLSPFASKLPAKRGGKARILPELACLRVASSWLPAEGLGPFAAWCPSGSILFIVIGVAEFVVSCVEVDFDGAPSAAASFLIGRAAPVVF